MPQGGKGKGNGKPVDDGYPGDPVVLSAENPDFTGTDEQDIVYGGPGDTSNIIHGGGGQDYLYGEGGDDHLYGGNDRDNLLGGDGADSMYGEEGNDELFVDADDIIADGGPGINMLVFQYWDGAVEASLDDDGTVTVFDRTSGIEAGGTYINFQNFYGSSGGDILTGNINDNLILAYSGDDIVYGLGGDDDLYGQDGNDTIVGGAGSDYIRGDNGDDILIGGDLIGGLLNDGGIIVFDGVQDIFEIEKNYAGYDTIYDFEAGIDKLDIGSFRHGMRELTFEEAFVDGDDILDTVITWGRHDDRGVIILGVTQDDWSGDLLFA